MRNLYLLPVLAAASALSGCGGTENRGVETVHQAVVSRTDYVYDVAYGVGPEASRRLTAWFESLNVRYGDRVTIDDPSDNAANRAAVSNVANRYGLIVQGTAPVTQGEVAPGTFRVIVSRAKAEVPGCPDWTRTSHGNYNGDAPSNWGCATNASMAAMVANPEDLVSGRRPGTVSDNATSGAAIRKIKGAN